MNSQLYIIIGLAFALVAGFYFQREKNVAGLACAVVSFFLVCFGPLIANLP